MSPRRTKVAWWTGVAALAVVSWCLVGWFIEDSIVLDCTTGADRTATCTVTRHYWLRTDRTVVAGVSGVRMVTFNKGESYQLRLATASGTSGPYLRLLIDGDRRSVAREASRLTEQVIVAPGSSMRAQTGGPSSDGHDLMTVLIVMVIVAFLGGCSGIMVLLTGSELLWWLRDRLQR